MGDTAPDVPAGATFSFFNQIGFNNAGKTALRANLQGGGLGVDTFATYIQTSSGLALIFKTGDPTPGIPDRQFSSLDSLFLNNAGQIVFRCDIEPEFDVGEDSIWFGEVGSLTLIARAGSFPGTTTATTLRDPVLNDSGKVALSTTSGVWAGQPGSIQPIAQTGDPVPGSSSGEVFGSFPAGNPAINSAGHVAFVANGGIWSDRSGSLSRAVAAGVMPVGVPSGLVVGGLVSPVLNDADQIAFRGTLFGSGVTASNDTGIYRESAGVVALIAREGDAAPGVPAGANFGQFEASSYVLNALGQTAFLADVTGASVTTANDIGIWATDSSGLLQLIAREGDQLEVSPGSFRTISNLLFFTGTGNADSRPSGFNELGQLAFWARFTDMSEGLFVSDLVAESIPGDFNHDGNVDAADYVVWRKHDGTQLGYNTWRTHFGIVTTAVGTASHLVPESPTIILLFLFPCALLLNLWRQIRSA